VDDAVHVALNVPDASDALRLVTGATLVGLDRLTAVPLKDSESDGLAPPG
jgi:hypothetical protein